MLGFKIVLRLSAYNVPERKEGETK